MPWKFAAAYRKYVFISRTMDMKGMDSRMGMNMNHGGMNHGGMNMGEGKWHNTLEWKQSLKYYTVVPYVKASTCHLEDNIHKWCHRNTLQWCLEKTTRCQCQLLQVNTARCNTRCHHSSQIHRESSSTAWGWCTKGSKVRGSMDNFQSWMVASSLSIVGDSIKSSMSSFYALKEDMRHYSDAIKKKILSAYEAGSSLDEIKRSLGLAQRKWGKVRARKS